MLIQLMGRMNSNQTHMKGTLASAAVMRFGVLSSFPSLRSFIAILEVTFHELGSTMIDSGLILDVFQEAKIESSFAHMYGPF